jgi:beta-glucosidase
MTKIKLLILTVITLAQANSYAQQPLFREANAPIEERVNNLLQNLTLQEKISLLGYNSPGVPRLQIPAYNWWNEGLHGVGRAGEATVFPQAIALAATFNAPLIQEVADAISTEARAKYNLSTQMNRRLQYLGLTFWTPNINIFRDPRWGRGQETYGEDPYLTATIGTAFVKGLQGNDPNYLKTAACAKHFAVHSGPEATRHSFNAVIDEKDLRETYLYAFKKLVDSGVEAVMCAYNRVNGEPCCTGKTLLQDVLRNEWKFKGHVVTDCWALDDIWKQHKTIPTRIEVAATAVKTGVNLDCSNILQDDVMKAIEKGLLTENDVNDALAGNLKTQMKLGLYDNPSNSQYKNYGIDSIQNTFHVALARKTAQQSMVLLKNNGILPLKKEKTSSLMVLGSNASSLGVLLGNYHGISGNMATFAEGITKAAGPAMQVQYDQGYDFNDTVHFGGMWAAGQCDATIAVIGLSPVYEGEEGDAFLSPSGGDKTTLSLPKSQIAFMKKLRNNNNKPVIAVVTTGSAVDISSIEPYADAIVLAWYPGEQGGNALADVVFGNVSPSGRLPVTFYQSVADIPDFSDYSMKEHTYRYFTGKIQYPFGYGLGYSSFTYEWVQEPSAKYKAKDTIHFALRIKNTGNFDGDEVVQAYIEYPKAERMPLKELKAFGRVSVRKGDAGEIRLSIPISELQKWDLAGDKWKLYKGEYSVCIGKNARDMELKKGFRID